MSAFALLEKLLKSGLPTAGMPPRNDINKYAKGAALGGLLGMLMGSKRSGGGSSALKYGGVAALAALAWKTWQEHQAQQPAAAAGAATTPLATAPTSFGALPATQQEAHSRAMLQALIAAAKADGHMDEREQGLVHAEMERIEADAATRAWVDAELRRPVEPAEIAAAATSPEMAAEMYLASLLVVDQTSTMERAYLDALATALRLAPALKADLEARAAA